MLQIQVNGKELDVIDQELSLSWENIRFSQAIPDIYSTDCELPATPRNIEALGCYNLMERPQQYGQKIPAFITTEHGTQAGSITIDEVREDSITCTIYMGTLEGDVIDKPINQLVGDDGATTIPFGGTASRTPTTTITSVGKYLFWQSEEGRYMATPQYQNAPIIGSIHVDYLLSRIGSAIGWTLPAFDNGFVNTFLTAMGRKRVRNTPYTAVCNVLTVYVKDTPVQGLSCTWSSGGSYTAICDITSDENCTLMLELTCYYTVQTTTVVVTEAGGITHTYNMTAGASYTQNYNSLTLAVTANSTTRIRATTTSTINPPYLAIRATTAGQVAKNTDNPPDQEYWADVVTDPTNMIVTPFPCWEYQGIIGNLAEITLRDLLTGLCWLFGYRLDIDANNKVVAVSTADNIANLQDKATITAMRPNCDKVGKHNLIKWGGDERKGTDYANTGSDLLADEVTLYESPFTGVDERKGTDNNNVAYYAMYAPAWKQQKDEQDNWTLDVENEDWLPVSAITTAHSAEWGAPNLTQTPQQQLWAYSYGLDVLATHSLEVEVETYEQVDTATHKPISAADYIIVDGHRIMVIEGEYDGETGKNTIKGIIV